MDGKGADSLEAWLEALPLYTRILRRRIENLNALIVCCALWLIGLGAWHALIYGPAYWSISLLGGAVLLLLIFPLPLRLQPVARELLVVKLRLLRLAQRIVTGQITGREPWSVTLAAAVVARAPAPGPRLNPLHTLAAVGARLSTYFSREPVRITAGQLLLARALLLLILGVVVIGPWKILDLLNVPPAWHFAVGIPLLTAWGAALWRTSHRNRAECLVPYLRAELLRFQGAGGVPAEERQCNSVAYAIIAIGQLGVLSWLGSYLTTVTWMPFGFIFLLMPALAGQPASAMGLFAPALGALLLSWSVTVLWIKLNLTPRYRNRLRRQLAASMLMLRLADGTCAQRSPAGSQSAWERALTATSAKKPPLPEFPAVLEVAANLDAYLTEAPRVRRWHRVLTPAAYMTLVLGALAGMLPPLANLYSAYAVFALSAALLAPGLLHARRVSLWHEELSRHLAQLMLA